MLYKNLIYTFFLLLSIFSCTDTLSQKFDATSLFEQGEISSEKWWENQHVDRDLLKKPVNLQKCLDAQEAQEAQEARHVLKAWEHEPPYSTGIWIHPRSIKIRDWYDVFGPKAKPYKNSVGLSIVPYVEIAQEKYLIAPHIKKDGKFDTYYPVCEISLNEYFYSYPHYYPSILLHPKPKNQAQDVLFKKLLKAVENDQPFDLMARQTKKAKKPLLEDILHSVNHTQFLTELRIPFNVEIKVVDLKSWSYKHNPYRVEIHLPQPFIRLMKNAKLDLLQQMHLEGCDAHFEQKPPNRFLANCYAPPTALMITGFAMMRPTTIKEQNITFRPENIVSDITISTPLTYYLNTHLKPTKVADKKILSLPYQDIEQDLSFQINPSSETPECDITTRISLDDVRQEKPSLELKPEPVPVQWSDTMVYNKNYTIVQYSDKTACRDNTSTTVLGDTQASLPQDITPCAYFKLFDERYDEPVSKCTQPVKQDNQWIIDFTPNQCENKRKLIVVSTSKQVDSYGGKRIPQTIMKVIQNQLSAMSPFTLVTIKPGRELSEPLLQCEDLADLEESEAKQLIQRQVLQNVHFGATDLRALQDLDLVNLAYPKEQLHSVFYLTDNSGIPTDLARINDKHLSVPVITWKRANIRFTVLTTGSCKPWLERAEADQCEELHRKKVVEQIQRTLEDFLNSTTD